jgi:hypothetical protein
VFDQLRAYQSLLNQSQQSLRRRCPVKSGWNCDLGSDPVRSPRETVRTNWWTERDCELCVLRRSTPRQTRWSPHRHWPVLQLLLLFPSKEGFRGWGWVDRGSRFCRVRPGGHLIFVGRFCRRSPSPRTWRAHSDPGRFQIGSDGLPTHPGLSLDAPSESSQGDLLFFRFAQDVAHTIEDYCLALESTSPSLTLVGRFSGDLHWPRNHTRCAFVLPGKSSTTEIPLDKRAHSCGASALLNREEHFTNPGRSVISPGNRASRNSSCTRRIVFSRLAKSLREWTCPPPSCRTRKSTLRRCSCLPMTCYRSPLEMICLLALHLVHCFYEMLVSREFSE